MNPDIPAYYRTAGWKRVRGVVLERDNYVCQYCGDQAVTADHVVPYSSLGKNNPKNLVACCGPCNKAAGGFRFESFDHKKSYIRWKRELEQTIRLEDMPFTWAHRNKLVKELEDKRRKYAEKKGKTYVPRGQRHGFLIKTKKQYDFFSLLARGVIPNRYNSNVEKIREALVETNREELP